MFAVRSLPFLPFLRGILVHAFTPDRAIADAPLYPFRRFIGYAHHYALDSGGWLLNEGEPFYPTGPAPEMAEFGAAISGDNSWPAIGAPGYPQENPGSVPIYAYDYDDTIFAHENSNAHPARRVVRLSVSSKTYFRRLSNREPGKHPGLQPRNHCFGALPLRSHMPRMASTTRSTVIPKCSNKAAAGADAPKPAIPITSPSRPT